MKVQNKDADRLTIFDIPKSYDDALKVAKSLVSWIQYLKDNDLKLTDPYSSFGGHIEFHLATLNVWNIEMKIKSNARALRVLVEGETAKL
jgi:hypothetical protein